MTSTPHGLAGPLSQKNDPFGVCVPYCWVDCERMGLASGPFGSYSVPIERTVFATPEPVTYCHSRGVGVGLQLSPQSAPAGRFEAQDGEPYVGWPADVNGHTARAICSPFSSPVTLTYTACPCPSWLVGPAVTVQACGPAAQGRFTVGAQELDSGGQDVDVSCDIEVPAVIDVPAADAEALVCAGAKTTRKSAPIAKATASRIGTPIRFVITSRFLDLSVSVARTRLPTERQ